MFCAMEDLPVVLFSLSMEVQAIIHMPGQAREVRHTTRLPLTV